VFLHIHDELTVGEVEDRFSSCFPYLAIRFYSQPHGRFEASDNRFRCRPGSRVRDIRKNHLAGAFEIKSWFTVSKVERALRERFGLNAQVFRCDGEGNLVQTTESDNLTLREQSELCYSLNEGNGNLEQDG
jgi:hypothetical protein